MAPRYIIHRSADRGHANHGWLRSHFSFSFANWYDPQKMGFGVLRVLNDDTVAASRGFSSHPHSNMEIVSIPLSGELIHKDSMGTESIIKPGDVQRMSAGTGVIHSEFNNREDQDVSFLQIWIEPREQGTTPSYDQKHFAQLSHKDTFHLLVSPDGRDATVSIGQDAYFSLLALSAAKQSEYHKYLAKNLVYLFVLEGEAKIFGEKLLRRDAMGVQEGKIVIDASKETTILVIEVPQE